MHSLEEYIIIILEMIVLIWRCCGVRPSKCWSGQSVLSNGKCPLSAEFLVFSFSYGFCTIGFYTLVLWILETVLLKQSADCTSSVNGLTCCCCFFVGVWFWSSFRLFAVNSCSSNTAIHSYQQWWVTCSLYCSVHVLYTIIFGKRHHCWIHVHLYMYHCILQPGLLIRHFFAWFRY